MASMKENGINTVTRGKDEGHVVVLRANIT